MLMTLFQVLSSRQVIYRKEKKSISVVTQVPVSGHTASCLSLLGVTFTCLERVHLLVG